jgi:hypothetical protein
LTAGSVFNTGSSAFVATTGGGVLRLTAVGASQTLFPVGTSAYAPIWITNSGAIDTIGVSVVSDPAAPPYGGRVRVKWNINESAPGGGNYTLQFGWMTSLEDVTFRLNRQSHGRIFNLTDTTEAGTGDYTRQFAAQPFTVSRAGITTLGPFAVGAFAPITGVSERPAKGGIPTEFILSQNYPNPFLSGAKFRFAGNPSTTIRYSLPKSTHAVVTIYDMLGTRVRTLVNSLQNAGEHSVTWDGRDDRAEPVASGVYFYRLEAGKLKMQKKMVLLQ